MARIDTTYTDEQIRQFASRDVGIMSQSAPANDVEVYNGIVDYVTYPLLSLYNSIDANGRIGGYFSCGLRKRLDIFKWTQPGRVVGLIQGENDDGSLQIALLGNDIKFTYTGSNSNIAYSNTVYYAVPQNVDDPDDLPDILTIGDNMQIRVGDEGGGYTVLEDAASYTNFNWRFREHVNSIQDLGSVRTTGVYQGHIIRDSGQTSYLDMTITKNPENTLILGYGANQSVAYCRLNKYPTAIYATVGNMFEFMSKRYEDSKALISSFDNTYMWLTSETTIFDQTKTHAWNIEYYNLILTSSQSEALQYLKDGTIPSDAIIHPLDWDSPPRYENDENDGGDGSADDDRKNNDDGEDGDNSRDTDPTPIVTPDFTPQRMTNNNLYWLQAGQLEDFIKWFWDEAGDIADLEDLWQKIQGLYNNLASAVINTRYMPININWAGGTSSTDSIIVGQIEKPGTYAKINKSNPQIRTLGHFKISEKYKSFCDYSPYTHVSLYLPFHGFMDIDADLFMGYTLEVKCVYDIMSGTIQYFIYCEDYLVNTCVAKMAVDIPITLQSKNDRDSAIFGNIMNAAAGIMSAGMSAASGNPIGLVMGMGTIAQGGSQSAPMKTFGNIGETGAFYAPQKCAVYIRWPSYNRPKNYGARVGYPCNMQYKLSDLTGFTQCYNPKLTFSGSVKPLQSEIDEILDELEKGVIL